MEWLEDGTFSVTSIGGGGRGGDHFIEIGDMGEMEGFI